MKRLSWTTAIMCLLCGLIGAAALATPSTLIWIPSTDIQPDKVPHFGWDTYAASGVKPMHDIGLTYGLVNKLEFGVDYVHFPTPTPDGGRDGIWFNAKYLLTDQKGSMPRVVIGAYNVGSKDDAAPNFFYLLGSTTTKAARFTYGVATGRESVLLVDETTLLLGIDKTFSPKWWGAIDYQSGKSAFGALNAGVSYCFNPNTSLIVGYDWYNDSALTDTWTFQLDVNF